MILFATFCFFLSIFKVVSLHIDAKSTSLGDIYSKLRYLLKNEDSVYGRKPASNYAKKQHENLLSMNKYYNPDDDAVSSDDDGGDLNDGFFYLEAFPDSSCSTTPIYSFGYRLKRCTIMYDINLNPLYSVEGYCSTSQFTLSAFKSLDCSGNPTNATFSPINICQNGFETGKSYIALCSSGPEVPVAMNSVLVKGYEGNDTKTCSGENDVTAFEAYSQNTCFVSSNPDSSFQLECPATGNGDITDYVYGSSSTCGASTIPQTYPIPQNCTAIDTPEFEYVASLISLSSISGGNGAISSKENMKNVNTYTNSNIDVDEDAIRYMGMDIHNHIANHFNVAREKISGLYILNYIDTQSLRGYASLKNLEKASSGPTGYAEVKLYVNTDCNVEDNVGGIGYALEECLVYMENGKPMFSSYFTITQDFPSQNYYFTNNSYATTNCTGQYIYSGAILIGSCIDVTYPGNSIKSVSIVNANMTIFEPTTDTYVSAFYEELDTTCKTDPWQYDVILPGVCLQYNNYSYYIVCTDNIPEAYLFSGVGCESSKGIISLNKSCSASTTGAYGGISRTLCVSTNLPDDIIPKMDDMVNNNVTKNDDIVTDDAIPFSLNATYLFSDASVECYYASTPTPTMIPSALPTMSPTIPLISLLIFQKISGCSYYSYRNDTEAYENAIQSALLKSIPSITESMLLALDVLKPPLSTTTYLEISSVIQTSSSAISVSTIESQLNQAISLGQFNNYLQNASALYGATDLEDATCDSAYYVDFSPTSSPVSSPITDDDNINSLPPGAIVGIIAGVVVVLAIVSLVVYLYLKKKRIKLQGELNQQLNPNQTETHGITNLMSSDQAYTPPKVTSSTTIAAAATIDTTLNSKFDGSDAASTSKNYGVSEKTEGESVATTKNPMLKPNI